MRKLSEKDLNTIRQYNKNLSELYLMVENGCQSDITVNDMTECMECICSLIKTNTMANTSTDMHKKILKFYARLFVIRQLRFRNRRKKWSDLNMKICTGACKNCSENQSQSVERFAEKWLNCSLIY